MRDTAQAVSRENVETVRRGYEAWVRDGLEVALAEFIAPDVELHDIIEMPDGKVWRGHDEARAMWTQWQETWEEFQFSLEDATDLGGPHVLARVRAVGRIRGSESSVEVSFYEVWTMRNGKGVRRIAAMELDEALKAAGLSE
jgi:ketosteroid isomerase-like protein